MALLLCSAIMTPHTSTGVQRKEEETVLMMARRRRKERKESRSTCFPSCGPRLALPGPDQHVSRRLLSNAQRSIFRPQRQRDTRNSQEMVVIRMGNYRWQYSRSNVTVAVEDFKFSSSVSFMVMDVVI